MKMKRTTLRDVANKTNLSIATVSMVINKTSGYERISAETQKLILQAAEQLNYQPNLLAQALRRKNSMQIAFASPSIYHPFTPELIDSMGQALKERNYSLLLLDFTRVTETEARQTISRLKQGSIDGIIMHSMSDLIPPSEVEELPAVYLDEKGVKPSVWFDAESAIQKLVYHFFDQGVYDIGFIGSNKDNETFRAR